MEVAFPGTPLTEAHAAQRELLGNWPGGDHHLPGRRPITTASPSTYRTPPSSCTTAGLGVHNFLLQEDASHLNFQLLRSQCRVSLVANQAGRPYLVNPHQPGPEQRRQPHHRLRQRAIRRTRCGFDGGALSTVPHTLTFAHGGFAAQTFAYTSATSGSVQLDEVGRPPGSRQVHYCGLEVEVASVFLGIVHASPAVVHELGGVRYVDGDAVVIGTAR